MFETQMHSLMLMTVIDVYTLRGSQTSWRTGESAPDSPD